MTFCFFLLFEKFEPLYKLEAYIMDWQFKFIGFFPLKDMQTSPPLRNDPHHFLIVYDAQCSESNENVNKKNFRFLFFELSSIFHSIFSEKWH